MREIAAVFEKGFTLGLRAFANHPRNTDALTRCMDMVPNPLGIIGRPEIFNPFEGDFLVQWPWPKLFKTQAGKYLANRTAFYTVDDNWTIRSLGSPTWTLPPHCADFGGVSYFGSDVAYMVTAEGALYRMLDAEINFRTCVNYRGQLMVGNCSLPKGPKLTEAPRAVVQNATQVGGENVVAWSKISALNFTFGLDCEAGWAVMPWEGKVRKLLLLGDDVVAYGDAGIAKIKAIDNVVRSFGVVEFARFGILNDDAVDGDGQRHIFIGNDRNLYMIIPTRALSADGYSPQLIGYNEFIQNMINPIVVFEPIHRHWWVCGEGSALVLSEQGAGEASISLTGVISEDGFPVGITRKLQEPGADVTTDTISFGTRGIKLLTTIELDMESPDDSYSKVLWRVDYRRPFQEGANIFIDPRGTVYPMAAGTEFRINFNSPNFASTQLSKLRLRYKTVDRQSTRGAVNAGKIAE
ncbi:MAG: hypothetical protein RR450_04775 [Oscillospiraceae bacterium]